MTLWGNLVCHTLDVAFLSCHFFVIHCYEQTQLKLNSIHCSRSFTIVFPLNNMIGSCRFPVEYANVQSAYADLSSQPVKSLWRPDETKQNKTNKFLLNEQYKR